MTCFTSCGDDDEDEPDPVTEETVDPLIGTWIEDDDEIPYTLVFSENSRGSVQFEISGDNAPARATIVVRQSFQWSKGVSADGVTYVNILTTSGDEILEDGRYSYTIIGNSMMFGGLRFTRH